MSSLKISLSISKVLSEPTEAMKKFLETLRQRGSGSLHIGPVEDQKAAAWIPKISPSGSIPAAMQAWRVLAPVAPLLQSGNRAVLPQPTTPQAAPCLQALVALPARPVWARCPAQRVNRARHPCNQGVWPSSPRAFIAKIPPFTRSFAFRRHRSIVFATPGVASLGL